MEHDVETYQNLKKEYDNAIMNKTSDYWSGYIQDIVSEIEENGLSNFGKKYIANAGGFGDAPKITKRPLIRKLCKIPFIYHFLEKKYVEFRLGRVKTTFFNNLRNSKYFSQVDLLEYIAKKIDNRTRTVSPLRIVDIDKFQIPHSYTKGAIYLHMIDKIIEFNDLNISMKDIMANNVMDIGGGIGSILHTFYEFNQFKRINVNSKFFLLDQFPVSYIARQNLRFFSEQNVAIFNGGLLDDTNIYVIQNTSNKSFRNNNISLFLNSSSFQEMDNEQVLEYIDLIKSNAAENSYLASFLYPSFKKENSDKATIRILNDNFELLGWEKNYFDIYWGGVSGILYLYKIK
ncbi:putative sugar O-methyltransferase [Alphaproteobacteria bacterium]|nr:putative sugar O-methyltransferase [Alphaproteobacteria bacterium]MDC1157095.1 putative sugar O-methyltransferase [Alphaproteobacteria bacterium]